MTMFLIILHHRVFFFYRKGIPVIPKSPYSLDLSLAGSFYSELKFNLKDHHYGNANNVQRAVTDKLKTITLNVF